MNRNKHQHLNWATCLSARHAQFNWKVDIFKFQIGFFQSCWFPERWSGKLRTMGAKLLFPSTLPGREISSLLGNAKHVAY